MPETYRSLRVLSTPGGGAIVVPMPLQGVVNYPPPLPLLPAVLASPLHLFKRQHHDREIELVVGEPQLGGLAVAQAERGQQGKSRARTSLRCLGQDGTAFLWTTNATA